MYKISNHPILEVPKVEKVKFTFNGKDIYGEKGFTIAAALHQAPQFAQPQPFAGVWHW